MKKIYSALIFSMAAAGVFSYAPQAYAANTPGSKVITVSASTGTLTKKNPNSSFAYRWQSNETDPSVTIECGSTTNNMTFVGEDLACYVGTLEAGKTYSISVSGDYYISNVKADIANCASGQSITLNLGGTSYTSTDASQHIEANYIQGADVKMVLGGGNYGVKMQNFQITVSPTSMPKEGAVRPTTLTGSEFAASTTWYTMQIGNGSLVIGDNANADYISLNRSISKLEPSDQWCFVGNDTDGYTIYNRAVGASKQLAAPTAMLGTTGGESYPILKAPGDGTYFYKWDILPSSDITGTYYIAQHGNVANAINNRNGKLAFWTTGKDHGSSVALIMTEQLFDLIPTRGVVSETANSWASWQTRPRFTLTGSNPASVRVDGNALILKGNNTFNYTLDIENGYVEAFECDATILSGNPILNLISNNSKKSRASQHISLTDLTLENQPAFEIKGDGEIALTNIRVKMRRGLDKPSGDVIFRYDGTPGYTVVYRIPAIATVNAGPNAGRVIALNDYRYSGADIGAGRIDLYQTYSDDNGKTWSTPDHMRNAQGTPVAQGDNSTGITCGFGDAAMLSDRETGKLLVLACAGRVGFFGSRRAKPQPTVAWTSEDGGTTWSEFTDMTETIYSLFDGEPTYGNIDGEFVGSGRMMQSRFVKVGKYYRIYMAIASQNAGGNTRNWVLYSDDFGKTWDILGGKYGAPIVGDGDESKVEELPDGSVIIAGRNRYGNRNFNIYYYTNAQTAAGYWDTKATTQLGLPNAINACDGEIMMVPARKISSGQTCYIMLQSVPFGPGRSRVGIVWKALNKPSDYNTPANLVANWNGKFQVTKMNSAYSTMTWQLDNTIGFLFEESTFGRDYCGVYRNLDLQTITNNEYEYVADPNNDIAKSIAGVNEIISNGNREVRWFDTFGREVKDFLPGHIYIGSDGSKKLIRK